MDQDAYLQKLSSSMQQIERQTAEAATPSGIPYLLKIDETAVNITSQFATVTIGGKSVKCMLASDNYCVVFQDPSSPVPVLFRGGGSGMWRD